MALFQVPGWTVPSNPSASKQPGAGAGTSNPKKRKRPSHNKEKDTDDAEGEAARIRAAQKNLEKLMKRFGDESGGVDGEDLSAKKVQKTGMGEKKGKEKEHKVGKRAENGEKRKTGGKDGDNGGKRPAKVPDVGKDAQKPERRKKGKGDRGGGNEDSRQAEHNAELNVEDAANQPPKDNEKKKKRAKKAKEPTADDTSEAGSSTPKSSPTKTKIKPSPAAKTAASGLTALQANMKQSLEGARFRWINEVLYKSSSGDAHQMMREDPGVFEEYHNGFRHQVTSWPSNPVEHYITTLSKLPKGSVIVDLGCGDAALAKTLVPQSYTVISYDLVSSDPFVVEVDICGRLPLPGGEGARGEESEGDAGKDVAQGQIVDVVVCSLSLMSTNWLESVKEARRVLKSQGQLRIAEVASRFEDVDEFVSVVSAVGFKLDKKDASNSHFTLFDFKKIPRKPMSAGEWKKILARGDVLQPCEYKRR